MSKMDNLRAMREARYAETQARSRTAAAPRPARPAVAPKTVDLPPAKPLGEPAADGLCGHRNMAGRTCTREKGHTAKSHRYS